MISIFKKSINVESYYLQKPNQTKVRLQTSEVGKSSRRFHWKKLEKNRDHPKTRSRRYLVQSTRCL